MNDLKLHKRLNEIASKKQKSNSMKYNKNKIL